MLAPERNAETLEMERMILDTVRRITAEKVAPRAAEIDATGKYPQDIRDIFAENELFSVPFPEEYGGLGLGKVGYCILLEEIGKVDASHGAIVVGLLPLSTAVAGVWLARERPSLGFWLTSLIATAILLMFVLQESDGHLGVADAALMGAVVCAALGYAAGGQLAARLGSWQVICWALAIALPGLIVVALVAGIRPQLPAPPSAWIGFAYVTLVSQLAGFFAWYRGLAMGGIARVSQTQLLQVFFTLIASAALLGEAADARLIGYALQRTRHPAAKNPSPGYEAAAGY